jgi:hypothetical protein
LAVGTGLEENRDEPVNETLGDFGNPHDWTRRHATMSTGAAVDQSDSSLLVQIAPTAHLWQAASADS